MVNYARDALIDESALDVEFLEQTNLMIRYAEHASQTKREAEEAKENLELVRAGLDKDIRQNPANYGLEKLTETVVSNTIILQPEYQEASKRLIQANYEAGMARFAAQAISDRKNCLEALVKLHGQQYFAGPKIPRDLTTEAQKRKQQGEVDTKVKISRRKTG
jgi:hypothetical protein